MRRLFGVHGGAASWHAPRRLRVLEKLSWVPPPEASGGEETGDSEGPLEGLFEGLPHAPAEAAEEAPKGAPKAPKEKKKKEKKEKPTFGVCSRRYGKGYGGWGG
ncbi:unnamed protein product, partial [Symbiodinium sp. KB8]